MTFEEWLEKTKKSGKEETTDTKATVNKAPTYEQWLGVQKANEVDQKYIDTFFDDANSFLGSVEEEYNGIGWGTASSSYESRSNAWSDLSFRSAAIRSWLNNNKSSMDDDTFNSFSSTLDSIDSSGASVLDAFKSARDFYAQWDNEDAYNEWQKAEDEKNAVLNSSDFEDNSKYASTESDNWWKKLWSSYGLGYDDLTYEYINNQNGLRDEIKHQHSLYSQGGGESIYEERGYDHLDEKEIGIYNYYYATEGKERAQEYLDSLEDELVQRKAGKEFAVLEGNTFLELVFGVSAGIDQFRSGIENLGAFFTGDEGHTSSTQYVSGLVREDLADNGFNILGSSVGQIGYDLLNTTANMLPSILVGAATGGLGGALTLGASATGNAYTEMRKLGYDKWQSRGYAALVGASETTLQYLLGGIGKLGGKVSGNAVGKLISGIDNAFAKVAIKLGSNMASEGLEEALQTVLEPAFKSLVTGEEYEAAEWSEILYSGLLGALSAGALEGVSTVTSEVAANKEAKEKYGDGRGFVDEMLRHSTEGSDLRTLANKYSTKLNQGKSLSGAQLVHLSKAYEADLVSQDKSSIQNAVKNRLIELGATEDVEDFDAVASALAKQAAGEKLTLSEKSAIQNSEYGRRVANELDPKKIASGEYTSTWAEKIGTRRVNPQAYNKEAYDQARKIASMAKSIEKASVDGAVSEAESEAGKEFAVSEDGKTVITAEGSRSGEEVTIKGVASTEGGKLMLTLDDGSTVDAADVSFGSADEALMYEMVARMEVTPDTANEFLKRFKPTTEGQSLEYFANVPLAYTYGLIGYEAGLANIGMSEMDKRTAYDRGRADAIVRASTATKSTSKKAAATTEKGGIVYEGFEYDESTATEVQKASMVAIDMITKMTSLKVHVFASEVGADGARVAMVNGVLRNAPNGYFQNGNDIYIDINAGNKGEGAMLYAMGHEVVHYIKKWNAKGFKILGDFLIEQYGKQGVPVHALLESQKETKRKSYETDGLPVPSDAKLTEEAYEELVADAMSTMLADPKAYEKLAKLKQKNRTVWQKLGEAIKSLLNKLKSLLGVYKGYKPDAVEAQYVMDFAPDVYEKLQDLYLRAFVEADANYAAAMASGEVDLDGNENVHTFSDRSMIEGAGLQFIINEDGVSYKVLDKNGKPVKKVTADMIVNSPLGNLVTMAKNEGFLGAGKEATLAAQMQYKFLADLVNMCIDYNGLAPIWETAGTMVFSAMKSNADKQYGLTIDFSTVCKKTQAIVDAMSEAMLRLGRGLTRSEVETIYLEVGKAGESTPCPVCYVFSRWMGIGGILDQMSRFQDKYTAMSEASIQEFIADIEGRIEEMAYTVGKDGKPKAKFFNKKGEISKGQVIAELKNKAASKAASAVKAIEQNSKTQAKIQEFEALMEHQDPKEAKKTAKKIETKKKKLVDVAAMEKQMREANDLIEEYEAYQWLTRTLMMESDGVWVKNPEFKSVPKEILFDLNKGDKFAEGYPLSWAFRTGKGASAGKAIVPYADARVGESIQAVAYQSPKDVKIGLELNPFLNGDTKERLRLLKSAIAKQARQNLLGGQRYQSTSDFRYEYGSDYLITFLEMQAIGAKVQLYTKVIEAVDFLASMGADCNLSVMPLSDGFIPLPDGTKKLIYSSVTGINAEAAIQKAHEYDNVQLILVGISDEHIRLALEGTDITYVIPFHGSGNNVHQIQALMKLLGEDLDVTTARDYTDVQSDHVSPKQTKEQKAMWDLRLKIVQGKASNLTAAEYALLDKNAFLKDLYRRFYLDQNAEEYHVALTSDQAGQIFPYEYWDKSLTYAEADKNGDRFQEYCASMGIIPRFSGLNSKGERVYYEDDDGNHIYFGDFTKDKGYWKLLIDRPMYDNEYDSEGNWIGYGKYHEQKRINCSNFQVRHLDPEYGSATYGDVMSKENDPKKTNKIVDAAIRQFEGTSYSERTPYSYEALVSKPDMTVAALDATTPKNRADVVSQAKKNAASVGKANNDGSVSVHVKDIGEDVVLSTFGLRHSLDRRFDVNAPVVLRAGEILRDSIRINEMTPQHQSADSSYVLIGAARNADGELYIVRSVVNKFKSELVSMDVLYAINAKTEPNMETKKGNQAGAYPQGLRLNNRFLTDSTISIAHLLDFVNRYFPDILPESVLRHYGYTSRPEGKLGKSALYSERSKAPTFYSHMAKVIDGIKTDKVGAGGVVPYLKGKGVKAEEIKWSGIEAWLEGKKSVTKAELQEFVAGSMLQITEHISGEDIHLRYDGSERAYSLYDSNGEVIDTFTYNEFLDGYVADSNEEVYADEYELREALRDSYGKDSAPKWESYKLDGGSNYRELVFQLPNSSYSNAAMRTHWGEDAEGVIAHARIQDMTTTDGKRMLFIEEIQSDWHNEGAKSGYDDAELFEKQKTLKQKAHEAFLRLEDYSVAATGLAGEWETIEKTPRGAKLLREYRELEAESKAVDEAYLRAIPDAPFRTTYHEYVLKRLIRMAAEQGYDAIGWTPADVQSERWSDRYAEGYRIEYDQDIPSFLRKYGKKWGATVGKTALPSLDTKFKFYDVNRQEEYSSFVEWQNAVERDLKAQGATMRNLKYESDDNYWIAYDKVSGVEYDRAEIRKTSGSVWSMTIPDSMRDSVLHEGQPMYSERVTDRKTLAFLENQEHVTVYRAMQLIDGKLYPPMNAYTTDEKGNRVLVTASEIGAWEQSVERPDLIDPKTGKFKLDKGKVDGGKKGTVIPAAYNPYIHTSLSMLNDQFTSAYTRSNLVVVKGVVPKSELTSGYHAQGAKDSVGETAWHSGVVSTQLPESRRVILSRWFKPLEVVDNDVVAQSIKEMLGDTGIEIPFNVVSPKLRRSLEKIGVPIGEGRGLRGLPSKDAVQYSERNSDSVSTRSLLAKALESVAANDIERNKLRQYKEKIALLEAAQAKLAEIRKEAYALRFTKGRTATETARMRELEAEATRMANRINTYDKQLLSLESTAALKGVLEREKAMLRKRLAQKEKAAVKAQKEKAAATQRELLTRYQESRKAAIESRKKTATRHKIKDVVADLNRLLLNPTKEQHVPIGLQRVVAAALDAINMDMMNAEERVAYYNDLIAKAQSEEEIARLTKTRDFFEYRDMNFKDRINELKAAYAEFLNSDDPLIRNAHNEAIEELIKNTADAVGNKSLRDMSLPQLEAVHNMYKAVLATVRNANKLFIEGRNATVSETSEAVKTEVDDVGGHRDRVLKMLKGIKQFGWNLLKPVAAMKVIGSKTFAKLFDKVRAAEDTWAVDVSEAKDFYDSVAEKYGYRGWDFKKEYTFKDKNGASFTITLEQMMSLYAYSKREQADEHLEVGGFVFDDTIEVVEKKHGIPLKYEVNDATPYRIGKQEIAAIVSALTDGQRGFVDEMQAYLSDVMGAKGNEVSLAMYDIKLYNEKHYFPLKTSRYFREFDPEKSANPKVKNAGFSKKTVPNAGNPIVLSNFMDVWASHVNDMSMYHAFVLPLEDFTRVYNYSSTAGGYDSVQQYIKNAYGAQANMYIERLLTDLNGGARVDSAAGIINKFLGLFKKASVFASASVVIQQPSAMARAMAYINPKYFATATPAAFNLPKHKAAWAEVKKYAPVAIIKEMGYFDTGVGRSSVDWIKGNTTVMSKLDDVFSRPAALADELAWVYIWEAVKKEVAETSGLAVGSEEFFRKAGERFTEVVVNTQVYDSVLSRSGVMRSKDTGMKMATAFMAEPITTMNMMIDGITQGKRGNKKFTASTVGAVAAQVILNSALVAIVYAARDDDEDETYLEKYLGSLTSELIDGFNPIGYIPFVKDIWSIAQGYDVERSDMSVINNLWRAVEGMLSEDKSGLDKVLDVTGAVSSMFGLPAKNLIRDGRAIYNLFEMAFDGIQTTSGGIKNSIGEAIKETIPLWDQLAEEKTASDKLYDAIVRGDTAYADRLKSTYDDDDKVESAIRQGLRNNDPRIKEAAQARYGGDIAEYTRIAKEIIAEGNFSQDTVVAAINAEINALKKDEEGEEESTEKKETSIYTSSDYFTAIVGGDTATANAVKEDLINTAIANGKSREDAESSVYSSFRTACRDAYAEGSLSRDKAMNMLVSHGGMEANDAYWEMKRFDYYAANGTTDGYSKYTTFHEAVKTGTNLKTVIKEYLDHGVTKTTLASQITSYYKPLYIQMSKSERAGIKGYLLNAYALLGYNRFDKSKDIDKWLED